MIKLDYTNCTFKAAQLRWPFMVIMIVLFVACETYDEVKKPKGEIIAEVGPNYLTAAELVKVFGEDWRLKKKKVNNFIRIWAKDKIVGIEAEKVLSETDKDFSSEINSYQNSLLKFTYEQKMLDTALSLVVNDNEVLTYFNSNKKNFELKENIVRVRYVKVPKKHRSLNKIKYMIQYKDDSKKEKFFELIKKENIFCEANDSLWHKIADLKNLIPFKLYNDEHFLRNYKYTEAPDGDFIWILYFTENILKKGVAPIDMVNDQIKAIIINQRKQQLVQSLGKAAFDKGIKNKEIKIYVKD